MKSTGAGINPACTAAPKLASPINTGTVTVSGTWTQADASKPAANAVISLYKNGAALSTTATVTSGGTWSIAGVTAAAGDKFYAKAQVSGESACLESNSVLVPACASRSNVTGIAISCGGDRGFKGTAPSGAIVRIYTVSSSGYTLYADETTTTYKIIHDATTPTIWYYDG